MDKSTIIFIAAAIAIVATRLYQKYVKQNKNNSAAGTKSSFGGSFQASSKDDDYEPYSKK